MQTVCNRNCRARGPLFLFIWISLAASSLYGAESPYFVTYSHQMEEPGSLEISLNSLTGKPDGGHRFLNTLTEIEYGLKGWWTTELYLHGQSTFSESALFTGYRWENRFRLLPREHWINPVLYIEWEQINGADKSMQEVVGFDAGDDFLGPNDQTRKEKKHELEAKLILSSNVKGWNVSENFVAEKNLTHAPFEFGYAIGVNRPLALAASAKPCSLCRENFRAGVELYGGLGTHENFGFQHGTSHYIAPTAAWQLPNGLTLQISPAFGMTGPSSRFLLRAAASYEISQFGRSLRRMFR